MPKYLTRYHNTQLDNIKNILKSGIRGKEDYPVFTTSNPKLWHTQRRPAQVELQIPKEWFKENLVDNPDFDLGPLNDGSKSSWNVIRQADEYKLNRPLMNAYGYKNGGRTSNFKEVPPEFIKRVCLDVDNKNCYSVEEYLKLLGD